MRQFARALLAAGVTKGSSVALMLGNRPEFVIAAFGAGSIGAVVVPVSTFASSDERDYILRHSDACRPGHPGVAVSTTASSTSCSTATPSSPRASRGSSAPPPSRSSGASSRSTPHRTDTVEQWDDFVARADEMLRGAPRRGDGRGAPARPRHHHLHLGHERPPEGACSTPTARRSSRAGDGRRRSGLTPEDKLLSRFPYFWSGGFTMTLGGPLAAGATVIIVETFDAGAALELMERERVTALQVMPETYNEIVEHPDFRTRDLSALTLAVGAEPLVAALPDRPWRAQANGYGLTETFTLCTWAEPEETGGEFRIVHGRPLPGIDLRIVDSETGEPLPTGRARRDRGQGRDVHARLPQGRPAEYLDRNDVSRGVGCEDRHRRAPVDDLAARVAPLLDANAQDLSLVDDLAGVGVRHGRRRRARA